MNWIGRSFLDAFVILLWITTIVQRLKIKKLEREIADLRANIIQLWERAK